MGVADDFIINLGHRLLDNFKEGNATYAEDSEFIEIAVEEIIKVTQSEDERREKLFKSSRETETEGD